MSERGSLEACQVYLVRCEDDSRQLLGGKKVHAGDQLFLSGQVMFFLTNLGAQGGIGVELPEQ